MNIGDVFDSVAQVCCKPRGIKGEDAFAYNLARPDVHGLAVFDGCGGAGAWKYPEFKNATGAFVAAQRMAGVFQNWFQGILPPLLSQPQLLADNFQNTAEAHLQQLKQSCAPMGVAGSLVKSFPCTAAIAMMHMSDTNRPTLTALNAGDSRVYYLTPEYGLVQLTKDDSRGEPDALKSLRENAPLSNLLNADKPFWVVARQIQISLPCAVLCATDGIFGFVRSPMDFEYLLLKAIMDADSIASFEECFEERIREITGDDSTCLLAFYGWNSYAKIRNALKKRFEYVGRLINELNSAGNNPEAEEAMVNRQWQAYKKQTIFDEMQERI